VLSDPYLDSDDAINAERDGKYDASSRDRST
jgi:hypothetical protein